MFEDLVKKAQNPNFNMGVTQIETKEPQVGKKPHQKKHLYKGQRYTMTEVAEMAGIKYQTAASRFHKWKDIALVIEHPGFRS